MASSPNPADRRTAADRAYYAAFLFSRDTLFAKGYITPYYGSEDHEYVARELKSKRILGMAGSDENRLRVARNKVTYDTREVGSPSLEWFVRTSEEIIAKVKALPRVSEQKRS
ncbi:MAG: hypothetical protein Q7R34_08095 [Dehalococcoidia bacterium]|nr:hypothetical protein [Dehalococcoidia bacterium]